MKSENKVKKGRKSSDKVFNLSKGGKGSYGDKKKETKKET